MQNSYVASALGNPRDSYLNKQRRAHMDQYSEAVEK